MTNYCTLWPEGWWSDCCKQHDEAYAAQLDRSQADYALFKCVANSGAVNSVSLIVALVMFVGVSIFGRFFYKRKQ